jgi:hypothetical protein
MLQIVEHQNDGTSARKYIQSGSALMGTPSQEEMLPTEAFR